MHLSFPRARAERSAKVYSLKTCAEHVHPTQAEGHRRGDQRHALGAAAEEDDDDDEALARGHGLGEGSRRSPPKQERRLAEKWTRAHRCWAHAREVAQGAMMSAVLSWPIMADRGRAAEREREKESKVDWLFKCKLMVGYLGQLC